MTNKIAVIGDVMLDRYIEGTVDRISPEAPVPVMKCTGKAEFLGGAGNVAANLARLGREVDLYTTLGLDKTGDCIQALCSGLGINLEAKLHHQVSTLKVRYVDKVSNQQLIRADWESYSKPLKDRIEIRRITDPKKYDAVVYSDYGKGVFAKDRNEIYHPYTFIDSKNWLAFSARPTSGRGFFIKPNKLEYDPDMMQYYTYVLKTLGKDGMDLFSRETFLQTFHIPPSSQSYVYNVIGAGDLVIACVVHYWLDQHSMVNACKMAEKQAAEAVKRPYTCIVEGE